MDNYRAHQEKLDSIKIDLGREFPRSLRVYDRHVGLFLTPGGRPVKINKKGMCDLWGVLTCAPLAGGPPLAVHLEIETKTGRGRLSADQRKWRAKCLAMRVWHFVHRDNKKLIDEIRNSVGQSLLKVWSNDLTILGET